MTDVGGSPGNARTALTVANSVGNTQTFDGVEVTAPAGVAGAYPAQNSQSYAGGVDVTAEVAFLGATVSGCTPDAGRGRGHGRQDRLPLLGRQRRHEGVRECGTLQQRAGRGRRRRPAVLRARRVRRRYRGQRGHPGHSSRARATTRCGRHRGRRGRHDDRPVVRELVVRRDPRIGDTLNAGSSRGVHGSLGIVKPDVAAPGTGIASVASGRLTQPGIKSGTSMATPHVAGIAALVKEAHPGWSATQVKTAVMNTASHDVWTGQDGTGTAYGPERVARAASMRSTR
ncbi:S8 family serine peptidase [Oerskovia sp. M15]